MAIQNLPEAMFYARERRRTPLRAGRAVGALESCASPAPSPIDRCRTRYLWAPRRAQPVNCDFRPGEDHIEADAHCSQHKQTSERKRYIEIRTGNHHHIPDAFVGGDGLGHNGADKRQGDCDL